MAKKRTSAKQASLLKQEIPEMPEGYYSSDPNPNLRSFVEEYTTAYDPEADDRANSNLLGSCHRMIRFVSEPRPNSLTFIQCKGATF